MCRICGQAHKSLAKHITGTHLLTKEAYIAQHGGPIKCEKTRLRYSEQNRVNSQWIVRAKAGGDDLSEYRAKMSAAVSAAIMANPEERARRAKTWAATNQTQEARDRASRTAKRTSARPEVQAQRAAKLKRWRDENPEKFVELLERFVSSGCSISRPEVELSNILDRNFPNADWAHAALFTPLNDDSVSLLKTTNPSGRTQVDVISRRLQVVVEFDGIHHFKPVKSQEVLERTIRKDRVKNSVISNEGFCLIRVSYDQWLQRGRFKGECVGRLYDLISDPVPGVHFIGEHRAGCQ